MIDRLAERDAAVVALGAIAGDAGVVEDRVGEVRCVVAVHTILVVRIGRDVV